MADEKKKISEVEAMPTKSIPQELISNTLSRLPVKTLLRFRCVCQSWLAIITDPAFVKSHLSQSLATNTHLSLIFKHPSIPHLHSVELEDVYEQAAEVEHKPIQSFKFSVNVDLVGSCNGLLCLYHSEKNIFLWNPSIRRHQILPITPKEFPNFYFTYLIAHGFGYDPTTDDYKLVRVVQFFNNDNDESLYSVVEVYSLNTNSWRRNCDIPFLSINTDRCYGVLANSALHWLALPWTGPYFASYFSYWVIVSFDLKDEKYREMPLPEFSEDIFHMTIGVLGGQLYLLSYFANLSVELWVMKDYGIEDSWMKQFSIGGLDFVIGPFNFIRPICYSNNGEVLMEKDSKELILYDSRRGKAKNLRIRVLSETTTCVGSLVPLNTKD